MFTYAGFITLTPEGRETFEKAPEYLDEFKHYIESEKAKIGKFEAIKTETFPLEKVDVFFKALV
jgi:hypothetical protein